MARVADAMRKQKPVLTSPLPPFTKRFIKCHILPITILKPRTKKTIAKAIKTNPIIKAHPLAWFYEKSLC